MTSSDINTSIFSSFWSNISLFLLVILSVGYFQSSKNINKIMKFTGQNTAVLFMSFLLKTTIQLSFSLGGRLGKIDGWSCLFLVKCPSSHTCHRFSMEGLMNFFFGVWTNQHILKLQDTSYHSASTHKNPLAHLNLRSALNSVPLGILCMFLRMDFWDSISWPCKCEK